MGGLDSYDPVLLELFRAEMDTHLPALSQGLLALEKGKASPKDLEAMMRAAHSIKGAARIVGIEAAVRVAHGMEDCFSAAQGERLTLNSESTDVLLRGLDVLQVICSPQGDTVMTEHTLEALLGQIAIVRDGKLSSPSPPPAQEPAKVPVKNAAATPVRRLADKGAALAESGLTKSAADSQLCHLCLPESFDDDAARSLRNTLCEILRQAPSRLRIDFSPVQLMSAAALSLLASFAREINQGPTVLQVSAEGISAPMAVLLRTSGLDQTFRPLSETELHDE